jgi:hypothetical protein
MNIITNILRIPIKAYRLILSPLLGANCRFEPSCSSYALEALEKHGPLYGSWLIAIRIIKCNPWGGHGFDPVPTVKNKNILK